MDKERKTIYLCLAHMSEDGMEQKYVKEAFDTNWVVPLGPNVNGFEDDLKTFVSKNSDGSELSREVVALSAGTAAVHLGLLACGVGLVMRFAYRALLSVLLLILLLILVLRLYSSTRNQTHGTWTLNCWKKPSSTARRRRVSIRRQSCQWLSMACLTTATASWR